MFVTILLTIAEAVLPTAFSAFLRSILQPAKPAPVDVVRDADDARRAVKTDQKDVDDDPNNIDTHPRTADR